MFQVFIKFSGVLAIFSAWVLVIYPAIRYGINTKRETVSLATLENKKVGKIVGLGLIVGTFFQIMFLFYLTQKFSLSYLNLGCLLYLSANLATILVAIFTYRKYPVIHNFFTKYYFSIMPISLVLITFPIRNTSANILFIFSLLMFVLYLFGQIFLFIKHKEGNSLMEAWAFVTLSVWTLVMTFVPGL
ncbi:MAG: DUF998 domain-containing protein [Candidatus Paceibacterota bacterium]